MARAQAPASLPVPETNVRDDRASAGDDATDRAIMLAARKEQCLVKTTSVGQKREIPLAEEFIEMMPNFYRAPVE